MKRKPLKKKERAVQTKCDVKQERSLSKYNEKI